MAYPKLTPITATGSTAPRYLGDRFADIVNVKDFGAVGDGVADDTTAFTAAQNSGAQAVMVPNGTYKITEDVAGVFFSFGSIATTGGGDVEIIDILSFDSIPTGTVLWLSTPTVPAGYLLCNGSAVGRATYPELFAAIGMTYGAGDGSTTFNLPNLIDKFAEGSTVAGTVKNAGLPNITGATPIGFDGIGGAIRNGYTGALYGSGGYDSLTAQHTGERTDYGVWELDIDASRSSSIYGNSNTVQPPALTLLPCIKAFASVVGDATVVAGQLVNDIQSKVSLDGSNASAIGKTLSTYMVHAAMPNFSHQVQVSLPYTAPADGWMRFMGGASPMYPSTTVLYSTNEGVFAISWDGVSNTVQSMCLVPVSKNTVVTLSSGTLIFCSFIYANGSVPA